MAGEPAESQGRNGQPKPASTSLFEWALALEQEQEKELVGAGRWAGMKGGEASAARSMASPCTAMYAALFSFLALRSRAASPARRLSR